MNSPLFGRIQETLADVLNLPREQITMQSSPDTIEAWDSLKHLDLVLALEQEFGLQFSPEEIAEMTSAELVVAVTSRKLSR